MKFIQLAIRPNPIISEMACKIRKIAMKKTKRKEKRKKKMIMMMITEEARTTNSII